MAEGLKFGTSGLRGPADELEGEVAARYAMAFLQHLGTSGQLGAATEVLVGRDLRQSSPAIAARVAGGVTAAGLVPRDCGELPTPALALEGVRRGVPAIMVTGSHIPADRNGLKFYAATGEITKHDEGGILESLKGVVAPPASNVRSEPGPEALEHYLQRCRLLIPPGALKGRRIGVWQHSGVFRDGLGTLIESLGASVVPLDRRESFYALDTEAISAADAAQIAAWVREHALSALVSTDGDADRPLLADATGEIVRGDVLGMLTAKYLGIAAVVTPVTSTSAVESCGWFKPVIRTRVGSPFVLAGMTRARLSHERALGFEANGGVLLGTPVRVNLREIAPLPTRDAVLPILCALGLSLRLGLPLSKLVATLPARVSRSARLEHVPVERSAALIEALGEAFFTDVGKVEEVGVVDGVRVVLAGGDVIHYRASGNAPELRCYTEAATADRADRLLDWGLRAAEAVVR